MSLLSVQNLSLSIHSFDILHDVTFTVDTGEIVAITGESGSGKSMTPCATCAATTSAWCSRNP